MNRCFFIRYARIAILALTGAVVLSSLSGCTPAPPMPSRHLYLGLDTSGSAREQIGGFRGVTVGLAETLTPERDRLTVYRVDRKTSEFYDRVYAGDVESLARTVVAETSVSAQGDEGTRLAEFWEQIATRAATEQGSEITICLLADGFNDDVRPASWERIQAAVRKLAANPRVRGVVLCGFHADTWQQWRTTLAPLGGRLHLLSPSQATPEAVLSASEQTTP
jgi:hypothetical protein